MQFHLKCRTHTIIWIQIHFVERQTPKSIKSPSNLNTYLGATIYKPIEFGLSLLNTMFCRKQNGPKGSAWAAKLASATAHAPLSVPQPRMFFSVLRHLGQASVKEKYLLLLGILCSPNSMRKWLAAVDNICQHAFLRKIPFDLASKPTHKFLHSALRPAQRSRVLISHYDILLRVLGGKRVHGLIGGHDLLLATLTGKSGRRYELRLERSPTWSGREGELTCRLLAQNEWATVATLSFAVGAARREGPIWLWIGGLQGSARQYGKSFTVQVTRDLFGLRPKDLLMHAVYALKEHFGASEIAATSNFGHVGRGIFGLRRWTADYDLYWTELGGKADGRYTFKLPPRLRRRSAKEVVAAKRSAWRARHALIDEMLEDLSKFRFRACRQPEDSARPSLGALEYGNHV